MQGVSRAYAQAKGAFYGWRIAGLMLGPRAGGTGVYIFGSTLFILPLEQALGMSRATSSLLFAMANLMSAASAPISGYFMDRVGPRKVLLLSVVVCSLGYAAFAAADSVTLVFVAFLGPISLTSLNVAFNVSTAIVNNWFDRNRATAMGVLQAGAGIGSLIILPILAFAINLWGWRAAALLGGGIILMLGLPGALFAKDTPEELGLFPDGNAARSNDGADDRLTGASTREALRSRAFWLLAMAGVFFGGAIVAVQVHFVPIMVWRGSSEVTAAAQLTMMAAASIPQVLFVGWIADRVGRLTVGAGLSLLAAAGVTLLNAGGGGWTTWVAALMLAGAQGIYPLTWATVGQLFGRRSYSTIRGYLMGLQGLAGVATPVAAGFLFERIGGYTQALWGVAIMWVLAAVVLTMTLRSASPLPTDQPRARA